MPIDISQELESITKTLNESRIEYALCGGLAVAIYGYPRATQDIDLLVMESDLNKIIDLLKPQGYVVQAGFITVGVGTDSELHLYRLSKVEDEDLLTLDLIFKTPSWENIWQNRVTLQMEGYQAKVVSMDGLKEMKKKARRKQDLADLEALEKISDETRSEG